MKKISIILFYFGEFPEWFEIFFETLKKNSSIKFHFYTDCDFQKYVSENVYFHNISFSDYVLLIQNKIQIPFNPATPYKLCDIRPMLGKIHYEDIKDADFYGYADIDLLFGNIREFYTDDILNKYDVISTHEQMLSDHFVLFRNNKLNREMYQRIGGWKEKVLASDCIGIGEAQLFYTYKKYISDQRKNKRNVLAYIFDFGIPKMYMKEQYSTPFSPIPWIDGTLHANQPDTWFYKDGKITNNRDGDRNFMYLHFMNFKSSKYRHDGTKAPWEGKEKICFIKTQNLYKGITINLNGLL